MSENLTYKTVHGIKWNYFSTLITSILQIGYTAVMARLLNPAAFGLIAMSGLVLRFGSYFAQMGIERALIQKKEINEEVISSSFTISLFLGIIFFILTWFLSPLSLYVFNNEKVVIIVKVMALSFFIIALSTTSSGLLKRDLNFRSIAVIEVTSYILGYICVGITMAFLGYGVWSLVFAALCQGFFNAIIAYVYVRHKLRFTFKLKNYKPLFSFGSKVTIISFFEFIGGSLDTLLIGRFLGASLLGIYNRAFMIVNLPLQNLNTSITKVLFPSFSIIQNEKQRLKNAFISSLSVSAFFLIPICILISISSKEVVLILLGEKWKASIGILRVLAIVAPFYLMSNYMGVLFESMAKLKVKLIFQISFVILLSIVLLSTVHFGLLYAALGLLGSAIIYHLGYLYLTKILLSLNFKEIIYTYYPAIIASLITGIFVLILNYILIKVSLNIVIRFLLQFLSFAGIFLILLKFPFTNGIKKILNDRIVSTFKDNIFIKIGKKLGFV